MTENPILTRARENDGKAHAGSAARVDGAMRAMVTLDYASGRTVQKAVQRFAAQASLADLESMRHTMNGIARALKYARADILAKGTATKPSDE